jgi:hypothetical protein
MMKRRCSKFEREAWNIESGGLNRVPGLTTTEILGNVHPRGVRSLYIMGENPMMSEPNLNHTRHQMEQLEFVVAQDLFINESGAFADVFLPPHPGLKKKAPLPTPIAGCSVFVRQSLPSVRLARLADCLRPGKAHRTAPGPSASAYWDYDHPSRSWKKWAASYQNMPELSTIASKRWASDPSIR